MWPFNRSQEDLELKKKLEQKAKEEEKIERDQKVAAFTTVHGYAKELGFPADKIDVRFYNHLFSILVDQNKRIAELEKQLLKKDS